LAFCLIVGFWRCFPRFELLFAFHFSLFVLFLAFLNYFWRLEIASLPAPFFISPFSSALYHQHFVISTLSSALCDPPLPSAPNSG
jgi:hypothetical protein